MDTYVLDLPVPPSVNRTRKVDWWGSQRIKAWHDKADALLMATKYRPLFLERFELHITLSEELVQTDPDNLLKALIDYLRRVEAIKNDAPKNVRKILVEWGEAPTGVRVRVRPYLAGAA